MNRLLNICVFLVLSVCLQAAMRSISDGEKIVLTYLQSDNALRHRMIMNEHSVLSELRFAGRSDGWMAFNTSKGYVLVGADDRQPLVLGYSDNGMFDFDSINDNLRYWLSCYDTEVRKELMEQSDEWLSRIQMLNEEETDGEKHFSAYPAEVLPLCPTQWNQGYPYNQKCPQYAQGRTAVTGCVATAMAQVMSAYQYPATGKGSHSYRWVRAEGDTVTLSADFEGTEYNWSLMLSEPTLMTFMPLYNQISQLMYHCGVSVDMGYGATSYSSTTTAARSMVDYFSYDAGIQNIQGDVIPKDSFICILHRELAEKRPVIIAATSEENTRHAFICDGYNTDGYYHINWGWGGNSDGYYLISALSPTGLQGAGSGGKTYGINQTLIVGIKPSEENKLPAPHMGIDSITIDTLKYRRGTYFSSWLDFSPEIKVNMVKVQNYGLYEFAGEYGLALMDVKKDSVLQILDSRNLTLRSGYYRTGTNRNNREVFMFRASAIKEKGAYRLAHVYKQNDEEHWYVSYARYSPSFLYVNVSTDSILFSYAKPENLNNPTDTTMETALTDATEPTIRVKPTLIRAGEKFEIVFDDGTVSKCADIEIYNAAAGPVCRLKNTQIPTYSDCLQVPGIYILRTKVKGKIYDSKLIVL